MRWGQVLGQKGDGRVARAVIDTPLGTSFRNEDFWRTVLQFFVNNPMLDPACMGPIVAYLAHQRFERPEVTGPNGQVKRLKSPEPRLAMKGRSVSRLLRQAGHWFAGLGPEDEQAGKMVLWCLQEAVLHWETTGGQRRLEGA